MNDTARRTTYKKRVTSLMKKVKELSILCGVEACAIVWPSPMEVVRVVGEFKSRPENDQTKKGLNQEDYTRQRVAKAKDQLVKQQKKNRRMEMENLIDFRDLMWSIDDRLKAVGHKMEYFHHRLPKPGGAAAPAAVPVAQKTVALESLENQMLMDIAPRPPDGLVTVAYPGGQDMMHPGPYGHYEDPSFWGPPFFA
ncbi:hypothetical protein PVL29_005700 [Vitis rotundifolia]|uniref:MADS-box domain-containing protein n=1 Tax=Vitis rotundifolia TaxID=103349 RepID=A0AA39DYD2_VITRO|nr:hypothetical protein PVL29_005700 [Vitis rotundifolia]